MSLIEVNEVSKSFRVSRRPAGISGMLANLVMPKYEKKQAVNNISFSIEPGEMVGFIGPNGAGKSTTIKMLSGILYPDSGRVQVTVIFPTDSAETMWGASVLYSDRNPSSNGICRSSTASNC